MNTPQTKPTAGPRYAGPTGSHNFHHSTDGKEGFIQCTYRNPACGCRVIGAGTLQHPLTIEYCVGHSANADLLAACKASLKVFQGWLHDVDPYNELGNDNPERAAACRMIEVVSAAIAKAEPERGWE